jgi:pimeloyl-ACP methyl ester carboxylesterase
MHHAPRATDRLVQLKHDGALWVHDIEGPRPDAPAVLLVHGLGVTAHLTWWRCYEPLSQHFRVLAFDLHGRGSRTRTFSLEGCASAALQILDAASVSRAIFAGYSLGGSVAKLAWRSAPERAIGLVLAATASDFGPREHTRTLRAAFHGMRAIAALRPEWLRRRLVERTLARLRGFESDEWIARELAGHDAATLLDAVRAAASFSSRSWLSEINVPVSVLITADDDRIPAERQRELAAGIPAATVFETPGDHTACATQPGFASAFVKACRHVAERADRAERAARAI